MSTPNPSILIVEDNPDDVELTLRTLNAIGVMTNFTVAQDGIEALSRLIGEGEGQPELPSLVLLDLNLPGISGLEVLKQIRAHPRTHSLPVVVLTSSDDRGDLAASCRLGATSYIRKNADPAKFRESMRRLADEWLEQYRPAGLTLLR